MISKIISGRLITCVMMVTLASACSRHHSERMAGPARPAEPVEPVETAEYVRADSGMPDDLALFGREPGMSDTAFEGRAATDLRQHTSGADGADFDPCVDPTGGYLAFASTRNSHNSHLYVKAVDGATITQITDGSSNDVQPEFDPTGRRIAFASDRAGQWDIWVIDANGRNPIQITNNPMPEMHPSWSPDGRRLVFCRIDPKENRNTLWVVDLENPGVKRLIGEGLFPAWSPKGDKIAYQRARARSSRYFSIWTIDIQGDEVLFPTEIATNPAGAMIAPAWSTDASQIAFTMIDPNSDPSPQVMTQRRSVPGRCDIGVVDVDGRGLQRLTDGGGQYFAPTWSSDGRVYFSMRESHVETIWSIKPFRPAEFPRSSPSATTASDRRAARADDVGIED